MWGINSRDSDTTEKVNLVYKSVLYYTYIQYQILPRGLAEACTSVEQGPAPQNLSLEPDCSVEPELGTGLWARALYIPC